MLARGFIGLMVAFALIPLEFATATEDLDQELTAAETSKERPEWTSALKDKYSFSEEQITKLTQSGMSRPQMVMAAEIAQQSGRSLDEVLNMRSEQKMGWGRMARELGLEPGAIGRAVADVRHRINSERKEGQMERKAERKAERQERRSERQERRGGKGPKGG